MDLNERANFSQYGKSFQEELVQLILEERTFADQIQEVFNVNFLELKYLRVFIQKIFEYKEQYSKHPSYKIMAPLLRTELASESEVTQKQVRDYFARIYKSEPDPDSAEYIKNTALDFCKKQKLKEAIIESVKLLKTSSFDEISTIINNALKLGAENNMGYEYLADFEKRFEQKARDPVSTGWNRIDELCKGGIGKGELGVVIAPTGAGKSMVLAHLGSQAVKAGKVVVHYTLELADVAVASRYDSCISRIDLQDRFERKQEIYDAIKDVEGKLIIKEYPTKSATTRTIKNHLEHLLKHDIKPDMLIVDYADLLRPVSYLKERRNELESIYEELRGIAQVSTCPIWTASQTNRSGLNAEVITMESISEAFSKCFVADFICSLSRTIDHKNTKGGNLFIAKNRNGPDGLVFPILMDPSTVYIEVLEQNHSTVAEAIAATVKEQEGRLRERYRDFKKERKKT